MHKDIIARLDGKGGGKSVTLDLPSDIFTDSERKVRAETDAKLAQKADKSELTSLAKEADLQRLKGEIDKKLDIDGYLTSAEFSDYKAQASKIITDIEKSLGHKITAQEAASIKAELERKIKSVMDSVHTVSRKVDGIDIPEIVSRDEIETRLADLKRELMVEIRKRLKSGGTTTVISQRGGSLPKGGDAGQVLAKVDGTDYNTQWVAQSGGSGSGSGGLLDGGSRVSGSGLIDGGSRV